MPHEYTETLIIGGGQAGLRRLERKAQPHRLLVGRVARRRHRRHVLADAEHLVSAGGQALAGAIMDEQRRPAAVGFEIAHLGAVGAAVMRYAVADFLVARVILRMLDQQQCRQRHAGRNPRPPRGDCGLPRPQIRAPRLWWQRRPPPNPGQTLAKPWPNPAQTQARCLPSNGLLPAPRLDAFNLKTAVQ